MADTSSQDDFEQKLADLGFAGKDFSSVEEAAPASENPTNATQEQVADMDKLDAARLQAAQAQNASSPQTTAPVPPNVGAAEEQARAQQGYQTEFPEPTPGPQGAPPSAIATAPTTPSTSYKPLPSNPLESNPELNDAALKEAQQRSNLGALVANLGQAGATFSANAIGQKPNDAYFENLAKQANVPVEQIMQRRDALMKNMTLAQQMLNYHTTQLNAQQLEQANDPTSDVSKGARGIVLQFEPKLANIPEFNKMSAADVKEFADHFLETEARVEGQKTSRQFAQQYKQQQMDQKQQVQDNKDFIAFGNKIEGGIASSRAAFGKNANVLRQADSAQQLLNQIQTQPGGADQRQYFELARTLDIMLSQGSGTISGTKELLPNTAGKKWGSVEEFFSNNPQPAALGSFVNRMQDTINRERNYAIQNNAQTIARIAPGYSHLKTKDTDRWNSILGAHGIQTDDAGNITGYNNKTQGGQLNASPTAPGNAPVTPGNAPVTPGNAPVTPGNAPVTPGQPSGTVTIKNKATGTVKTLDAQTAARYLNDPQHGQDFERVQ